MRKRLGLVPSSLLGMADIVPPERTRLQLRTVRPERISGHEEAA